MSILTGKEKKQQGRSTSEMVAEHGWNYFCAAERDFLATLPPPGGGAAIQHREVWEKLMETALDLRLQADVPAYKQPFSRRRFVSKPTSFSYRRRYDKRDNGRAGGKGTAPPARASSCSLPHRPGREVVEEMLTLWAACREKIK